MASASENFHEDKTKLAAATIERHRAIVSLMEELEAVDWYDQRVDATTDDDLRAILAHNRDEEKEHAAMMLEWLRRHDPSWDEQLRTYLFSKVAITEVEEMQEQQNEAADSQHTTVNGSLGIGSLRGGK
jgi:ferritin-like protein